MGKKHRLKILNEIEVKNPCTESWDAMQGDSIRKHCQHCCLDVTNISELSKGQAAKFLNRNSGKSICIRYRKDESGNLCFKPRLNFTTHFRTAIAVLMAGIYALLNLSLSAFAEKSSSSQSTDEVEQRDIMGELVAEPVETPNTARDLKATPKLRTTIGKIRAPQATITPKVEVNVMGRMPKRVDENPKAGN